MANVTQEQLIISIICIVIGLVLCFFGLKLSRVLIVITGLVVGGTIGTGIGVGLDLDSTVGIIVIVVGAVLFGILFFFLRRVGMFFLAFLFSAGTCAVVLFSIYELAVLEEAIQTTDGQIFIFIGLAVSLIIAILAAIFMDPLIIIITGIQGGSLAGLTAGSLFGITSTPLRYAIAIVLTLLGLWLQFWMHSRKIGKEEAAYAEKVREQNSVESEVEQARHVLSDDDDEDEDDEDY